VRPCSPSGQSLLELYRSADSPMVAAGVPMRPVRGVSFLGGTQVGRSVPPCGKGGSYGANRASA
jgi:hypothetical protein